jgi:hypothetical protein
VDSKLGGKLDTTAKAADSDKLDGHDTSYFATSTHTHSYELDDLTDVDAGSPSNDQVLKWDGTNSKWVPGTSSSGGATEIDDLTDVDTSTTAPGTNNNLKWDGTNWVPDSRLSSHITDTDNPHSVDKADVGLSNVDNTSDANKPISTATQTALNGKSDTSHTHSYDFDDLTDVEITTPSNGSFLRYYSSDGKWKNEATVHNWLDGRSNSDAHPISAITNLQTSLDGKLDTTAKAADSDKLDGHDTSYFAVSSHTHDSRYYTETEVDNLLNNKLDTTAKAADADKLDSHDSSYFATATHTHNYDIDDLTDVDTSTNAPSTNEVLKWDGSNWVPSTAIIAEGTGQGTKIPTIKVSTSDASGSAPNGTIWLKV